MTERCSSHPDWEYACIESKDQKALPPCLFGPSVDGEESLDEIARDEGEGAKCLKLHPNTQNFDVADPDIEKSVREAAEKGLPVLFDAYTSFDANQPGKFFMLAKNLPDARMILAHAHAAHFLDLIVY